MNDTPPTAVVELRGWPHWVVWRAEQRDGKPTKIPYVAASPLSTAKSDDPTTWGAYELAAQAVERGRAHGAGYVFASFDEYTGIDLDDCITDGEIHPAAMKIVERLDSYTEVSPSGAGLHIFIRARIKGKRKKTKKTPWGGHFENYDQKRFFTVTAQHLKGTPEIIESRQAELDEIREKLLPEPKDDAPTAAPNGRSRVIEDDSELLEKMFGARNGPRIQALYRGDTSAYDGDDSSADLALCNSLAFWTARDAGRMDRIFRTSGLMRDKWDSERPGGTYGSQTIDKAINGCKEAYGEGNKAALTRIFAERAVPKQRACDDLGELFGLKAVHDTFASGTRSTRDSRGVVDLYTVEGRHLHLAPLNAYTTAPKMAVEVGLQLGTKAYLDIAVMATVFALIGTICELQEEVTFEERAADLARTFIQEAPHGDVIWVDQGERWAGFLALRAKDPIIAAKANGTSIAAESLVLRDTTSGARFVRIGWFAAYVKAAGYGSDTVQRMASLGWKKAGDSKNGRVKATDPNGDGSLQWDFFEVPEGWEWV